MYLFLPLVYVKSQAYLTFLKKTWVQYDSLPKNNYVLWTAGAMASLTKHTLLNNVLDILHVPQKSFPQKSWDRLLVYESNLILWIFTIVYARQTNPQ